jgi:UDP-N-acetyl-D-galactosamine dehydrogenase
MKTPHNNDLLIAMIGLGYVGLPLAVEFGKMIPTIGFDINPARVKELEDGHDSTLEVDSENMQSATQLSYTSNSADIASANFFIITVPTPVDNYNNPDLTPLEKASETVGKRLKKGDYVVYESTVYPGATEEVCVPVLEKQSGLTYNKDFYVGYSPERINPGDKEHTVTKIKKVVSGSTPEAAAFINTVYQTVISAGTYLASSIKVAEAAKVIENTQRDVNIALINELSRLFNLLEIDTWEVLKAAGTKWNFLNFTPGLVGGHCIGVDPYYLTYKAEEIGYKPEIILAGRRINDGMGKYVASECIKLMVRKGASLKGGRALILGITFKENCPDIRNTKVIDIYSELKSYNLEVDVFDPWANAKEVMDEFAIPLKESFTNEKYDLIVAAVAHEEIKSFDFSGQMNEPCVVYDVKNILSEKDGSL